MIPNYGEKWRYSETITTAFVESTVNEVVAKRMAKKQQMQWSPEGAHNLLQTRTATLNSELSQYFERWYPGLPVARNEDQHDMKLAPESEQIYPPLCYALLAPGLRMLQAWSTVSGCVPLCRNTQSPSKHAFPDSR